MAEGFDSVVGTGRGRALVPLSGMGAFLCGVYWGPAVRIPSHVLLLRKTSTGNASQHAVGIPDYLAHQRQETNRTKDRPCHR